MKKTINRLANTGIISDMTTEQKGLLKLTNKTALYVFLFCSILGIIAFILSEYITAIYNLLIAIVFSITIVFNYFKSFNAAKLMLIFGAISISIFGSIFFGYDSVFKYVMILPITVTFIFFSEGKKWKLYLPLSFIIISILIFEFDKFYNHNFTHKNFNNGFQELHYTGHVLESLTFMLLIFIYISIQSYFRTILKKKESELMVYKKIFDNSHEGLSIIAPNGNYVKQNFAHKKIIGITKNEFTDETPAKHMSKEIYNEVVENIEKAGEYEGEFISKTKRGYKHINLMAFNIIENNKTQCFVGITRDITKQKILKLKLENSEKKYRTLVNLMGEGLGIMDLNEKFIFANPQMENIFEVEQGTLINKYLTDFLDQEPLNIKQKQSIFLREEVTSTRRLIIRSHYEQIKYVRITAAPFIDNHKRIGTIAVIVDITEREKTLKALKESEENLKNADAAKDKFFSIIGHDLRSPFNSLIGFSNLMMEDDTTPEEMKKFAKVINETSFSTFQLLDNLLDWARIQTNNLITNIQKTDLTELVNKSYLNAKNQAIEKNIEIIAHLDADIIIYIDRNMIETVLRNLIGNAIKYCKSGDLISIILKKTPNCVTISVKDTGVGINDDVLPKLFKIGHSISTRGTNREKGTGLGLILCKEFIENHGGNIFVESELGKGSVFTITLPLQKTISEKQ